MDGEMNEAIRHAEYQGQVAPRGEPITIQLLIQSNTIINIRSYFLVSVASRVYRYTDKIENNPSNIEA